jgi:predicted TIM-barrel fold metal-dependent hydrolase
MSSFEELSHLVNEIEIFDVHEHMAGFDWGFADETAPIGPTHPHKSLPHVLMNDMLLYICTSTGLDVPDLAPGSWQLEDAPRYWAAMQPVLEVLRNTAVYTLIKRGIKELYGFEGDEITDDNWEELNRRVLDNYCTKGAPAWMLEAMQKAKVKAIVQMAHLPYLLDYWPSLPAERQQQERAVVRPALILEPYFFSGFEPDRSRARQRTMDTLDMFPSTYDEHLEFMYTAVQRHKQAGGSAVKFICAYQRSLFFEEVADSEARRLYMHGIKRLDKAEMTTLQNNLVWHLVRAARDNDLPIMLHTGYSNPSTMGNPENLYNLAIAPEFRKANFYCAHAGWPNDGALALMARTYANVYFGFCWLPGLSPALATRMMDEMFDLLPASKMMIGMDCGTVEAFYGTTIVTREIIAKVLAGKVDSGLISRRAATTVANRILHDNGVNLFGRPEEKAAL